MYCFCEQVVLNEKSQQNNTKPLNVLRYLFLAGVFILSILSFMLPMNYGYKWLITPIFLVLALICFVIFWIISKVLNTIIAEYIYRIDNDTLQIIVFLQKRLRKLKTAIPLKSIKQVGFVGDQTYKALIKSHKKIRAYCHNEQQTAYLEYKNQNGKKLILIFHPDTDMLISLRRYTGRLTKFNLEKLSIDKNQQDTEVKTN